MKQEDIYGMFDDSEELTDELRKNAATTAAKLSLLTSHYGEEPEITSGFRPKGYNKSVGGSEHSKHMFCLAVDFYDPYKKFGQWCKLNEKLCAEMGIFFEELEYNDPVTGELRGTHSSEQPTKRWVHAQVVAPKSGKTFYIP